MLVSVHVSISCIFNHKFLQIMKRINILDSPDEQTKCICRFLSETTGEESSKFESAFDSFTSRIGAALSYIPSSIMKGHILLIRKQVIKYPLTESYDLEKVLNRHLQLYNKFVCIFFVLKCEDLKFDN